MDWELEWNWALQPQGQGVRYGQCPCWERIKKQQQRWDGKLGRRDNRVVSPPLVTARERRGWWCQWPALAGAALVLTQSHEQTGQKSQKLCCVQHSAARQHCLLSLCLRASSSCRVELQGNLPTAVHVQVIRLQNNGCWYKAEFAGLQLWISSKRSWFFCPHRAEKCWRKQKRQFIL